jgi:phage-related protein (TIGR01555 family)
MWMPFMSNVVPIRKMNDSLRNLVAGLGDPLRDKMAGAYYGFQLLDDFQLGNIYRSNWLGKKIINIPALDAVRKGRDWQAETDQIEEIEAEEARLGYWAKLLQAKTLARLWGGAAIYIGTKDGNLSEPLDVERMGKGGITYLTVVSRRDVSPGEVEQDVLSAFHGLPKYFEVTGSSTTSMVRIHPSRLAIFIGEPVGDSLLSVGSNYGWGDSVLEAVYSAMKNADATAANIASLVFEANVDIFRIPDFMASLSDPEYRARLLERFSLASAAKGNNRALVLDKYEEYDRKQISFATLPEVMQSFLQMVSGAADIPVTRLLGQSPAGMSATGESDMLNYYDRISSIQNLEMTPALHRLDECLIRSAIGSRPEEIFYSWAPLKQMTEKELAEIGKMNAETANTLVTSGLFMPAELRTVVTTQLVESSFYPGLDQAVEESGNEWEAELEEGKEQERLSAEAALEAAKNPKPAPVQDAAPRTLYIRRDVLNSADIAAWAKDQGFETVQDGLHVTIIHTRTPLDWIKVGQDWSVDDDGKLTIAPGGPRLMERFGEAVVLQFASGRLTWRHEDIKRMGADTDYPEYQPHVTISWGAAGIDLAKVEPYKGKIVLGPEIFEEVNDDWKVGVLSKDGTFLDKYNPSQPRNGEGEWSSGGGGIAGLSLTTSEVTAVKYYKNKNYKKLNSDLRKGGSPSDTVKGIDSAIAKTPGLEKKTELFRGLKSKDLAEAARTNPKSLIGKSVKDDAFMSTTTSNKMARSFAGISDKNGVVLKINVKKGTKALSMDQFGNKNTDNEKEMLLARGSSFKIKKISEWGSNIYIEADLED